MYWRKSNFVGLRWLGHRLPTPSEEADASSERVTGDETVDTQKTYGSMETAANKRAIATAEMDANDQTETTTEVIGED